MLFQNERKKYMAMHVEVAYASKEKQVLLAIEVPHSCTAQEAIQRSGILQLFAEIDLTTMSIGVFSKK